MHVFSAAKSNFTTILLWAMALIIPLPMILFGGEVDLKTRIFLGLLFFGFSGFFLWIWFDTNYKTDDEWLYYASGPFRGKIRIATIRRIEYDNRLMKTSMYRPALDHHGLIAYYEKYEDIFIAPKDKESLIAVLKIVNPEIEIQ